MKSKDLMQQMDSAIRVGALLLVCAIGWAQEAIGTPYDQFQWKLVKQATARFDIRDGPSRILLLRSVKPTGTDGLGEPMSDVKILVLRGATLAYESVKRRTQPDDPDLGFYMEDYLKVQDVTMDGVPEILFRSGYQGVSGFTKQEHVLSYDHASSTFKDIAPKSFYNSTTHGLRWLEVAGRMIAVVADRNWPASVRLEDQCHACKSPFQYDAYQWNTRRSVFEAYRHLNGKKEYFGAEQALKEGWTLMQTGLSH